MLVICFKLKHVRIPYFIKFIDYLPDMLHGNDDAVSKYFFELTSDIENLTLQFFAIR